MTKTRALYLCILAAGLLGATSAQPDQADESDAPHRSVALAAMGTGIAAVARAAGMTVAQLQKEVLHDSDLKYDKGNQRMLYACGGLVAAGAPGAHSHSHSHSHRRSLRAATTLADAAAPDPALSTAFTLHSRPSATRKLLLDFKGATLTNTAWNSAKAMPSIVIPAYDIDGQPGAFSNAELANIISIWREVAQDFAPFDVDVTTENLGYPATSLSRALIGGTNAWYNCGCGGVAYLNSYGRAFNQPALIFPGSLGGGNPKPGNIERSGDADWFSFTAASGPATVTLSLVPPHAPGGTPAVVSPWRSNLDVRVEVWSATIMGDATDKLLASWNPAGSVLRGAQPALELAARGKHFVSVTGVGDGASASVGYTAYGSLGEYVLAVEFSTSTMVA